MGGGHAPDFQHGAPRDLAAITLVIGTRCRAQRRRKRYQSSRPVAPSSRGHLGGFSQVAEGLLVAFHAVPLTHAFQVAAVSMCICVLTLVRPPADLAGGRGIDYGSAPGAEGTRGLFQRGADLAPPGAFAHQGVNVGLVAVTKVKACRGRLTGLFLVIPRARGAGGGGRGAHRRARRHGIVRACRHGRGGIRTHQGRSAAT